MESEARYVRVGIITLLLTALLAGGLFWLSGRAGQHDQNYYTVYFRVQSLEGLQINSDVRMQGVKVGKVTDYAIMPGEAHKVRVVLQVDARTPVLEGVKAVISRQLVTGLAAIDLDIPANATTPLTAVPTGEKYPVIPEGVSQFAQITDTAQALGQSFRESMDRVNTLLSDRNQRALANTLANLDSITTDLKQAMPELQATMASLHQASNQLSGLSTDARQSLGRMTGEATDTLVAVRGSLARMDHQMTDLTTRVQLTTDLAGQEIQSTAQSLGQAGDALQDTGRALSNPARALFGPSPNELGPGEEIKK